jgi:hypothetical protein
MNVKNKNQNEISDAERIVKMAQSGRKRVRRSKAFEKEWEEMMAWKYEQVKERDIGEYIWDTLLRTAQAITKIKGEEDAFYYTEMKPHLEFLKTLMSVCKRLLGELHDNAIDAEKREEIRGVTYKMIVSMDFLKGLLERFA